MKINSTIFSKPQQDQLKAGVGAELEKIEAKVGDVDKRMLNYMGDWATGNEYHENDVVTWDTDGHLYEVIKAHTSSATFNPDNPEYYKAMTARKVTSHNFKTPLSAYNYLKTVTIDKIKYITITANSTSWTLVPQTSTTEYSATRAFTTDGDIRQIILTIDPNSPIAYYIDTHSSGAREINAISNISEYTVYVEE